MSIVGKVNKMNLLLLISAIFLHHVTSVQSYSEIISPSYNKIKKMELYDDILDMLNGKEVVCSFHHLLLN